MRPQDPRQNKKELTLFWCLPQEEPKLIVQRADWRCRSRIEASGDESGSATRTCREIGCVGVAPVGSWACRQSSVVVVVVVVVTQGLRSNTAHIDFFPGGQQRKREARREAEGGRRSSIKRKRNGRTGREIVESLTGLRRLHLCVATR